MEMIVGVGLIRIKYFGIDVWKGGLVIGFFFWKYCEFFLYLLKNFGVCYVVKLSLGYEFFNFFLVVDS